ncbi:glycosyl hydrolase 108 family protein [Fodinicurvata halophila]
MYLRIPVWGKSRGFRSHKEVSAVNSPLSVRRVRSRLYPDAEASDVRHLDRAAAAALYREHFWQAQHCERLPLPVFDTAMS